MKRSDLLALNFYERAHFSGSENGLRFRVEKYIEPLPEDADEGAPKPPKQLRCWLWPEPLSFECTPDEKKTSRVFEFSEEGLAEISEWISLNSPDLSSPRRGGGA